MLNKDAKIFIAGHRGMVGSALVRQLTSMGFTELITRTHAELDLVDQQAVDDFFKSERIDAVFLAAAKVGGVHANNTYRADFIYLNLMIEANVIHAAYLNGVERLMFLGSSCIYPRNAPQPMKEEYLLSGYLEPTNEPYAIAKIAGIKLCEAYNHQYGTHYRSVMPTNLYGPGDNFDLVTSHVFAAMIRKFHLARLASIGDWDAVARDEAVFGPIRGDNKTNNETYQKNPSIYPSVLLWGSGSPRREFLHVDDMAAASIFAMQLTDDAYEKVVRCSIDDGKLLGFGSSDVNRSVSHINIGSGKDITIQELSKEIQTAVGFNGKVDWDASKPDGMPRKLLDISRINNLGWKPGISLKEGIRHTYQWYLKHSEYTGF